MYETLPEYLDHWAQEYPDETWLLERKGDDVIEWSWTTVRDEVNALASWQEKNLSGNQK